MSYEVSYDGSNDYVNGLGYTIKQFKPEGCRLVDKKKFASEEKKCILFFL